jgi:hypothetical protein
MRSTWGLELLVRVVVPLIGAALTFYSLSVARVYAVGLAPLHGWTFRLLALALVLALVLSLAAALSALRSSPAGLGRFLRGLTCTWVLAYAGYLACLQPHRYFGLALAAGLVPGAFAAGLLAAPAVARRLPARALRVADFALFQLCLFLLLGELGLRALARVRPMAILARGGGEAHLLVEAQRKPPGELFMGFPFNADGYYDEDFGALRPGERRVACIGDSFSVGVVPHVLHYTTVCERELPGVRVDNVGVQGVGPEEYIYLLEREVARLEPDAVVVALFVGNDFGPDQQYLRRDDPWHPALWFDRDNVLLWLVARRLARVRRELAATGDERVGAWMDGALEAHDPMAEVPTFSVETFLDIEVSRARTVCAEGAIDADVVREQLTRMRRAAGSVRLFALLLPDEFQVEDELWQAVVGALPGVALERDRAQRVVGELLAELGIPYADLLPRMRAVPALADGRRHVYHVRDTHFNARGNREAGLALAELLRSELPH